MLSLSRFLVFPSFALFFLLFPFHLLAQVSPQREDIFWGKMCEPVTDMDAAYADLDMGIPFTKKPRYRVLDYAAAIGNSGMISLGKGRKMETYTGKDQAVVLVHLQKCWEESGKIAAQRTATGGFLINPTTAWNQGYKLPLVYGKPSNTSLLSSFSQLNQTFYTVNSKGQHVPIQEVGWAAEGTVPTHLAIWPVWVSRCLIGQTWETNSD